MRNPISGVSWHVSPGLGVKHHQVHAVWAYAVLWPSHSLVVLSQGFLVARKISEVGTEGHHHFLLPDALPC